MENQTTDLYRHYDKHGNLLYVGISLSAVHRLSQHKSNSLWASEITSIEIERFTSREDALQAERQAIEQEKPVWNTTYNTSKNNKTSCSKRTQECFNLSNAPEAIICAAEKISRLWEIVSDVRVTASGSEGYLLEINFTLPSPSPYKDLGISEIFDLTCSPIPGMTFALSHARSAAEPNELVKSGYLSLLSGKDVEGRCKKCLGSHEGYDAIYYPVMLPAIKQYQKALKDCPSGLPYGSWDEIVRSMKRRKGRV